MGVKVCVDIQRPVEDVFAFASNSSNLPLYDKYILEARRLLMVHLVSVLYFTLTPTNLDCV